MIINPSSGQPMTAAKPVGPSIIKDHATGEDLLCPSVVVVGMSTSLIDIIANRVVDVIIARQEPARKETDGT